MQLTHVCLAVQTAWWRVNSCSAAAAAGRGQREGVKVICLLLFCITEVC